MKRKQWKIFLALTVMAGVLGVTGCRNKAETSGTSDDAVAVMANTAIDGEMQAGTETQTGEAEAGSSGESQSSETLSTEESSPDFPAETEPIKNSAPELPQAFCEEMEANINILKSTIESLKAQKEAERKEAQAKAEAEKKEAERKEAEARAAEEKAQAEAAAQPAPPAPTPSDPDTTYHDAGSIDCMYSLLEKVNEDRANNGVAELQWSDSLAQYCKDRIPVVKYNIENGLWRHEGATKAENLAYNCLTSSEANMDWINSPSHHENRLYGTDTMYAAAAYQDPETGTIIWIEAFE